MTTVRDTAVVRAHWNRLASSYDRREALIERWIAPLRTRLWQRARGRVLEVGTGTGQNFTFHPAGAAVVATDLAEQMVGRARERARHLGSPVDVREADVENLPFSADVFDSAVATFVFCSVPDPIRGLQELARVVKPGGKILLLEHVRLDRPMIGGLMDVLDPLFVRMGGSHINRRTVENVGRAGLEIIGVEEFGPMGVIKLIEASPLRKA